MKTGKVKREAGERSELCNYKVSTATLKQNNEVFMTNSLELLSSVQLAKLKEFLKYFEGSWSKILAFLHKI